MKHFLFMSLFCIFPVFANDEYRVTFQSTAVLPLSIVRTKNDTLHTRFIPLALSALTPLFSSLTVGAAVVAVFCADKAAEYVQNYKDSSTIIIEDEKSDQSDEIAQAVQQVQHEIHLQESCYAVEIVPEESVSVPIQKEKAAASAVAVACSACCNPRPKN